MSLTCFDQNTTETMFRCYNFMLSTSRVQLMQLDGQLGGGKDREAE